MPARTTNPGAVWPGGVVALLVAAAVLLALTAPIGLRSTLAQEDDPGEAQVRIVHASPDAGNVDVFLDGQPVATDLAFGAATDFLTVPAGERQILVAPAGSGTEGAVIDQALTFENGRTYQVAALGLLAEIQAQVYEVNRSPIAGANAARVRVVHAVEGLDAVDVATAGGEALFQNVTFPNATDYVEIEADTYDVEVRPTGTTEAALSAPGVQIQPAQVYDLFAIGQAGTQNLQILPLVTPAVPACATVLGVGEPDQACVRVVHASAGGPDVDVYVDDAPEPVAPGLVFGTATEFLPLPGGDHRLRVVGVGGSLDEPLLEQTVSLAAGRAYQVIALNEPDDMEGRVDEIDLSAVDPNMARLRFIHASPDAGTVNVVLGGQVLTEGLESNDSSPYTDVQVGAYPIELRGEDDAVVLQVPEVNVQANMVYDVVFIGRAEDRSLTALVLSAPTAQSGPEQGTPTAAGTPMSATPIASPAAATPTPVSAAEVAATPMAATPAP